MGVESKRSELAFDAKANKPHITRACGQWVCYWSGDIDLCVKAKKFARELNRKRWKTHTHK